MVTELVSFQRVIASGSTAAETVERLLLGICQLSHTVRMSGTRIKVTYVCEHGVVDALGA
jgi:hypothetical protein